jgi:hypothetical protein
LEQLILVFLDRNHGRNVPDDWVSNLEEKVSVTAQEEDVPEIFVIP